MPSERKVVSVHLVPRGSPVRDKAWPDTYTTGTATEFNPSRMRTQSRKTNQRYQKDNLLAKGVTKSCLKLTIILVQMTEKLTFY